MKIVKLVGGRVLIPAGLARQGGFSSTEPTGCWLIVLGAGRCRIVREDQAATDELAASLIELSERVGASGEPLDCTDDDSEAAIRARILPCTMTPPPPGWRVILPNEVIKLAPGGDNAKFVYVLVVAGYVEIWFPEMLRQSVSVPITKLLG